MEKQLEKLMGQFIRDNKDLIENYKFDLLYDNIYTVVFTPDSQMDFTSMLTDILTEIDINPLEHMTEVPKNYIPRNRQLKNIFIPNNITSIGARAFYRCLHLEKVDFPEGLTHIRSYAFDSCGLRNIYFPDSLEEIGRKAFSYNRSLEYISVGKNIMSLGLAPFEGCNKLKEMEFRGTKDEFMDSIWGEDKDIWDECEIRLIHCTDGDLNAINDETIDNWRFE